MLNEPHAILCAYFFLDGKISKKSRLQRIKDARLQAGAKCLPSFAAGPFAALLFWLVGWCGMGNGWLGGIQSKHNYTIPFQTNRARYLPIDK